MNNVKKIAVFYHHVASNVGDLAINDGINSIIKSTFPEAELKLFVLDGERSPHLKSSIRKNDNIVYISGKASDEIEYSTSQIGAFRHHLYDCELVIINSGEHYFQYEYEENSHSLFWRLLPALSSAHLRIPTIFFPSTVGPLNTEQSRLLFRKFMSCCTKIFLRDHNSLVYVNSIYDLEESERAKISLAPDPAFFLEHKAIDNDVEISSIPLENSIAVVMRLEDWGIRIKDEDRKKRNRQHIDESFVNSLSFKFVCFLVDDILAFSDKNIVLFTQTLADKKLNLALTEKYQDSGRVFHDEPTSVQDYLRKLDRVECVVASRFHALILGMVMKKQPYGVYFESHGHKMPGLFSLLNLNEFVVNLRFDNIKEAANKFSLAIIEKKSSGNDTDTFSSSELQKLKETFINSLKDINELKYVSNDCIHAFQEVMVSMACSIAAKDFDRISSNPRVDNDIGASSKDKFTMLATYFSNSFERQHEKDSPLAIDFTSYYDNFS